MVNNSTVLTAAGAALCDRKEFCLHEQDRLVPKIIAFRAIEMHVQCNATFRYPSPDNGVYFRDTHAQLWLLPFALQPIRTSSSNHLVC